MKSRFTPAVVVATLIALTPTVAFANNKSSGRSGGGSGSPGGSNFRSSNIGSNIGHHNTQMSQHNNHVQNHNTNVVKHDTFKNTGIHSNVLNQVKNTGIHSNVLNQVKNTGIHSNVVNHNKGINTQVLNHSKHNSAVTKINHQQHTQLKSLVNHVKNPKYHTQFGVQCHFGTKYCGHNHCHWSFCYWDYRYGCHCYWDPCCRGYYYWCQPDLCYYPVTYVPYQTFCWPTTTVVVQGATSAPAIPQPMVSDVPVIDPSLLNVAQPPQEAMDLPTEAAPPPALAKSN